MFAFQRIKLMIIPKVPDPERFLRKMFEEQSEGVQVSNHTIDGKSFMSCVFISQPDLLNDSCVQALVSTGPLCLVDPTNS